MTPSSPVRLFVAVLPSVPTQEALVQLAKAAPGQNDSCIPLPIRCDLLRSSPMLPQIDRVGKGAGQLLLAGGPGWADVPRDNRMVWDGLGHESSFYISSPASDDRLWRQLAVGAAIICAEYHACQHPESSAGAGTVVNATRFRRKNMERAVVSPHGKRTPFLGPPSGGENFSVGRLMQCNVLFFWIIRDLTLSEAGGVGCTKSEAVDKSDDTRKKRYSILYIRWVCCGRGASRVTRPQAGGRQKSMP